MYTDNIPDVACKYLDPLLDLLYTLHLTTSYLV